MASSTIAIARRRVSRPTPMPFPTSTARCFPAVWRSEEHTSELQSLMRISYAVFCLKKKTYFSLDALIDIWLLEYTYERLTTTRQLTFDLYLLYQTYNLYFLFLIA